VTARTYVVGMGNDDAVLNALRQLTGLPDATFRDDQREAVEALVERHERLVLVERTGWGKSAVYFVATKLLRDQGLGPTLLISPLLALMRNQMEAARRLGLRTYTINSASDSTVAELVELLERDEIDVLVVSPERLANPEFAEKAMPLVGARPGLTVIDEVHCISDWGHDFRPDYRRIGQMLSAFPAGMPILGCTATANNRVVEDAREQLGQGAIIQRGPLARSGLALHVIDLSEPSDRLAWLATHVGELPGSGIIYCLTKRDVESVSMWLTSQGISTKHYHGALDSVEREKLEQMLSDGTLKVIVATSALGMGYDNPRIAFVVHFQSPGSVVHYYQQVGRAGRALETSFGVLLRGVEDRDIIEWFISTAFPSEDQVAAVLAALESSDGPLSTVRIAENVNLPLGRIEHVLKQLDVEGVVRRVSAQRYERTLKAWTYPRERVEALAKIRRAEQTEMEHYAAGSGCRMAFLVNALDDHEFTTCGLCDNCTGGGFTTTLSPSLVLDAQRFLDHQFGTIEPRRQDSRRKKIPENEQLETGKYLSRWGDVGHGQAVRRGKREVGRFDESLVVAAAEMIREWSPTPDPVAVTFVPSLNHPSLVADVAKRIAEKLGLPLLDLVERIRGGNPQKTMQNSAHQAANVAGAFSINLDQLAHIELGPVLLIDDVVDSGWTMTEIGRLLRKSGFPNVFPVALATSAS